MRNCKSCGKFLHNTRIHLGYKECVRCSKVEQYSAHIVYPHKTGGYVQPVSKETKEHLQGLDRRSVKKGKVGRSSSSWDRWLKQYEENKNTPKPVRKIYSSPKVDYLLTRDALKVVTDVYESLGYYKAIDEVNNLYSKNKISLIQKSKLSNELTEWQMLTSKERKWHKKL